jgi:hypothetical protein
MPPGAIVNLSAPVYAGNVRLLLLLLLLLLLHMM